MQALQQVLFAFTLPLSTEQAYPPYELLSAINRNDIPVVKELLTDFRIPVHIPKCQPMDPYGFDETALLCSIKKTGFCAEIFNLLLENRADINQTAHTGLSPLHKALLCKNEAVARVLIIRGADTKAKLTIDKDLQLNASELAQKMNLRASAKLIRRVEQRKYSK